MHHYNHSPLGPLGALRSASKAPEPFGSSAMRYNEGPTSARDLSTGPPMTEERKYAILLAATPLCVRKLMQLDSDRPSPAKVAAVENAISQAAFILECIDRKWPE